MTDLARTIVPKSDQLNADDLIAGPRTITITAVKGSDNADQPISIHFEGDDGKPYKPCKSMRRVMVHVWGADGNAYAGRRMALFCDPNVVFGGIKVGGIRISHMSGIDRDVTMALTATRAQRKPYTVKPLPGGSGGQRAALVDLTALLAAGRSASLRGSAGLTEWWTGLTKAEKAAAKPALDEQLKPAAAKVDQAALDAADNGDVIDTDAHDPETGEIIEAELEPVDDTPEADMFPGDRPTTTLAAGDFDPVEWATEFNRKLLGMTEVSAIEAAWKAAKAEGKVLKLKAANPAMLRALQTAMEERAAEIEGAK